MKTLLAAVGLLAASAVASYANAGLWSIDNPCAFDPGFVTLVR